ncbi:MAG: UDP-N-acetylmuramate dehydrogenase [Bacteroidales bacterium]|nr:UDP-N-acetylmuramate dehydrogenase [Bacteroidales bacterium]
MKKFRDFSLKNYNTFSLEAYCKQFVELESIEDVLSAIEQGVFNEKFYVLGGGSNVLFTKDFEGTIVHPVMKGIQIEKETSDKIWLRVAAGENWNDLVHYAVEHNYYGIENLVEIPGNVGSAPVQNIGAYGVEIQSVLSEVCAIDLGTGKRVSFSKEECDFGYRSSVFKYGLKGKMLIVSILLELSKKEQYVLTYSALNDALNKSGTPISLKLVCDKVADIRASKLPKVGEVGSAGSFFKNPIVPKETFLKLQTQFADLTAYPVGDCEMKMSAAQLIDRAGCKNWRVGDIAVFPTQPLVIVNYGKAKGMEVLSFYKRIQTAVNEMFGILLEPEVNIL